MALAAQTQDTAQRMLVDEYYRSGTNSYVLAQPATELAAYLHKRALRVALVPDVSAAAAAAAAKSGDGVTANSVAGATKLRSLQSTNHVLMVAPTAFGFNEQAALDNSFMHTAQKPGEGSNLTAQVCGRRGRKAQ